MFVAALPDAKAITEGECCGYSPATNWFADGSHECVNPLGAAGIPQTLCYNPRKKRPWSPEGDGMKLQMCTILCSISPGALRKAEGSTSSRLAECPTEQGKYETGKNKAS